MNEDRGALDGVRIRRVAVGSLAIAEMAAIRTLLWAAFAGTDPMTESDWAHAMAGEHFVADLDGEIGAYASVAERQLFVDGKPIRAGYVEAVAVAPARQRRGIGTALMRVVDAHIDGSFELGALGTGEHGFYARLGWQTWQGKSSVRTPDGPRSTPDEDGFIMVRPTLSSLDLDLAAPIECDPRSGDAW